MITPKRKKTKALKLRPRVKLNEIGEDNTPEFLPIRSIFNGDSFVDVERSRFFQDLDNEVREAEEVSTNFLESCIDHSVLLPHLSEADGDSSGSNATEKNFLSPSTCPKHDMLPTFKILSPRPKRRCLG